MCSPDMMEQHTTEVIAFIMAGVLRRVRSLCASTIND